MNTKARKIIRALLFCLLLGIFGFALWVAILWMRMERDDRLARVEIQKKLDAIRAAGEPLTAEDMARLYPDPPPEHDAALLLKPALAALSVPKYSTNLPFFGGDFLSTGAAPLKKPMLDEMQLWVDKNQKAFDSVSFEGLKGSWIGCSFQNGFTNLVSEPISEIISLAKLLCVNAAFVAESRQPGAAAQSLIKALAIGNTCRNDLMLHGLIRIVTEQEVCRTLNRVLNRTELADSDLEAISDGLISTNLGTFKECLINERAFGMFHARKFQSLAEQAANRPSSILGRPIRLFQARLLYRDQDLLNYLEVYERRFAMVALPLSNAIPAIQTSKHAAKIFSENLPIKFFSIFLNMFKKDRFSFLSVLAPRIDTRFLSEAESVAEIRATRVAIAIERWRLAHNDSVPDSLTELVPDYLPAITTDPFDEQPMRYKKHDRGYVVYSIGKDFIDDGGKEKPDNAKDSDHYDITFTVDR